MIDLQHFFVIPNGIPAFDDMTRVSSVHRLLQTAIIHYFGLMKYYYHLSSKDKNDKFVKLWEKLDDEDWLLITEMEVLMRDIAKYSTGKVQKSGTLPSENIVFRALALKVTNQKKFKKHPLCRWNQTITLNTITKSETVKACESCGFLSGAAQCKIRQ